MCGEQDAVKALEVVRAQRAAMQNRACAAEKLIKKLKSQTAASERAPTAAGSVCEPRPAAGAISSTGTLTEEQQKRMASSLAAALERKRQRVVPACTAHGPEQGSSDTAHASSMTVASLRTV